MSPASTATAGSLTITETDNGVCLCWDSLSAPARRWTAAGHEQVLTRAQFDELKLAIEELETLALWRCP